MTPSRYGLIYEDLTTPSIFTGRRSKIFSKKTLNFLRKGTNATFGEFELMNLKQNSEVIYYFFTG